MGCLEEGEGGKYLRFKALEFIILGFLVRVDFLLCFVSGFLYSLCAVCIRGLSVWYSLLGFVTGYSYRCRDRIEGGEEVLHSLATQQTEISMISN